MSELQGDEAPRVKCSKCLRPSVIFQRYSGQHLCHEHFIADIESKIKRTIRENGWLKKNDKIGILLDRCGSGESVLLFLQRLTRDRPDISLIAIRIDEGIPGLCHERTDLVISYGNTGLVSVSLSGEFGSSPRECVGNSGFSVCACCRAMKHRILHRLYTELMLTRIVLGSTLDDSSDSVLAGLLTGGTDRYAGTIPAWRGRGQFVEPFREVPGDEAELYLSCILGRELPKPGCPYSLPAKRDISAAIDRYSVLHPSVRYSLLRFGDKIHSLSYPGPDQEMCEKCGCIARGECPVCSILDSVLNHRG